ncbi:C-GCAxxG-C-C family protein [Clostridium drakei]|uniref:C_GCAxxG_C_C family protein n=1 Tax=Clostridium drakei TaxID=332101 RepID=A0A2U8DPK5_9CLOT|nr:C-GCAxxG-C-C family protein [Clostridium drakei]AWI04716.1 hypothetical protein B9W14_09515 [Clostridium drakei]
MSKLEKAAEKHGNGYNCAQAVTCSFCEEMKIDESTAKEISKKYGGGAFKTCGAVMGMYIVSNFMSGEKNLDNPAELKNGNSDQLHKLEKIFKDKNGSVICAELKGKTGNKVLRSCRGCVEDAAMILEKYLENEK